MRVGFDASAVEGRTTGAGEYVRNLLRALGKQPRNHNSIVAYVSQTETAQARGVQLRVMPWSQGRSLQRILIGLVIWGQRVRRDNITVFHSPFFYAPMGLPCKRVVTVYDVRFLRHPSTYPFRRRIFLKTVVPRSLRSADHIIAISEHGKREIVELVGISPEKITVTHLAAHERYCAISDKNQLEAVRASLRLPERFLLFVGYLEPRKNLPRLLRAFHIIRARSDADLKLVIAGPLYWGCKELQGEIRRLQLSSDVIFTGYVKDRLLPYLYNLAELFIYPSLYEGFGLPILEAMACGTPVVASRSSSLPEVVGNAGELFDPFDVDDLASVALKVLARPDLREQMRAAGLKRAASFTWSSTAKTTWRAYESIMK